LTVAIADSHADIAFDLALAVVQHLPEVPLARISRLVDRRFVRHGVLLAPRIMVEVVCSLVNVPHMGPGGPATGRRGAVRVLGNSAVTGATGTGVVVSGDVGSSPTPTINNSPPSTTATPFNVHYTNDGVVQQAHLRWLSQQC
jgi:hypothetical protein